MNYSYFQCTHVGVFFFFFFCVFHLDACVGVCAVWFFWILFQIAVINKVQWKQTEPNSFRKSKTYLDSKSNAIHTYPYRYT